MKETTFIVPDMSCSHCKSAVEGQLNRLSGVERSDANLDNGTVEVAYDEGRVGTEQLKKAIEDAGYTVAA
jgi:copper chaperone